MKIQRLGTLMIVFTLLFFSGCSQRKEAQPTQLTGNWDPFNKRQIENLINQYGKEGKSYNPGKPPYVVFDWDNTSVFLDIQEATLIYQLENLLFGCTPETLDLALHTGIDTSIDLTDTNTNGDKITVNQVASDIINSYTWLYKHYRKLNGGGMQTLEEIKESSHYQNFITKVRFLYEAIYNTYSADAAYPWVTYLFAGLDSTKIATMTEQTVKWQQNQKIEKVTWISPTPKELPEQLAGQVTITWKNGLRLVPEMQELYNTLRKAGFDIWVCSASFVDVIKGISTNPDFGYNMEASHIMAMELERDSNGIILPEFRKGYDQTQGEGKTKTILRFLAGPSGKYGYDPVLIAGDSEGDQNMLTDFKGLKLGLIFNRLKGKGELLGELAQNAVDSYQKTDAKYLLQGRNENTGKLVPSQENIPYGETKGKKLP